MKEKATRRKILKTISFNKMVHGKKKKRPISKHETKIEYKKKRIKSKRINTKKKGKEKTAKQFNR